MAEASPPALARRAFHVLGAAALAVAALYWGQNIFVPLALAALLTLVLAPLVSRLEARGLGRVPAVLLVACLAFVLLGAVIWLVAAQAAALVNDLPRYKDTVRHRIDELQGHGKRGLLPTVLDFLDEVEKASQPAEAGGGPMVRIQPQRPSRLAQLQAVAGRFLGAVTVALLVALLVITLLIHREDLRNRVIRLAGRGHLTLTTRALDEAGRRLSAYLLRHSAVNLGFGAAAAGGLLLLGVPYPALWGLLAAALRFVPAVGVWLVAPFPALLAFIDPGGAALPLAVLGLFLALELVTGQVVEPRVCGPSVGVAPVPLLVAVLFWTGLWGVVGLVLATPLTVCLAVLGKHVRQLEPLGVLLGSRPALSAEARYYQRLLARDRREAEAVAREYLADRPLARLFDDVLLPALARVRRGRRSGELGPDDERYILQATGELAEALGEEQPAARPNAAPLLGLAACDGADEAALLLFRLLARAGGYDVHTVGGGPSAGVAALVQRERPAAVVVAALAPGGLTQARYLCRRLRSQFPGLRIVVGRWGRRRGPGRAGKALLAAGADRVVTTLREAGGQVADLARAAAPTEQGAAAAAVNGPGPAAP
jgi:predicted PurR-regulated permease PerM